MSWVMDATMQRIGRSDLAVPRTWAFAGGACNCHLHEPAGRGRVKIAVTRFADNFYGTLSHQKCGDSGLGKVRLPSGPPGTRIIPATSCLNGTQLDEV